MTQINVSKLVSYGVVQNTTPPFIKVSKLVGYGVVQNTTLPYVKVSKLVGYGVVQVPPIYSINVSKAVGYGVVVADNSGDLVQTNALLKPIYRSNLTGKPYLEFGTDKQLTLYFPALGEGDNTFTYVVRRPDGTFEVTTGTLPTGAGYKTLPITGNVNQMFVAKGTLSNDLLAVVKLSMNKRADSSTVLPPAP